MKSQMLFCLFVIAFVASTAVSIQAQQAVHPIEGYDGVQFGSTFHELKERLASVPGISKKASGEPLLEKVPTKAYYRYYVQRSKAKGELTSEVSIYFRDGKVTQFRDVFGGTHVGTSESASRTFNEKVKELTKLWGAPTTKRKLLATWGRDDRKAVLSLELPANQYALPILKLTVTGK